MVGTEVRVRSKMRLLSQRPSLYVYVSEAERWWGKSLALLLHAILSRFPDGTCRECMEVDEDRC